MSRVLSVGSMGVAMAVAALGAADFGPGLSHREREEIRRKESRRKNPAPEPEIETRQMRRARERREAKAARKAST